MEEKEAKKQIDNICKQNNLHIKYKLEFPVYRILPDEVKLALNILEKHGMVIKFELEEKKQ